MRVEVEGGAIRDADALKPPEGAEDFAIPTILGVVRHLGGQVLPEADMLLADTGNRQEQMRPHDHVAHNLALDDTRLEGLAHGHPERLLTSQLLVRVEERDHLRRDRVELGMLRAGRVHKVLDLCLRELALPGQARARGDLVAEGLADLSDSKRQPVRVLLDAELVVQEDALRSLRTQVPLQVAAGADGRGEHEVELVRIAQLVARLGGVDLVLLEDVGHLLEREAVSHIPHHGVLLFLVLGQALRFQLLLHDLLQ
mmetsp:Transcript_32593/g.91712  ORF Transcript_32593/g.91712 Transcript_32593/m.91712 type:complete len:256 (+) Transcript_32593:924-1691(+)